MNSFNSYDISLQSSNKSQGMKPNQELMIQENISYKAFIINITIFIQGFQTDFFKYKTKCTKHLAKNSRLDHHSHDDLNIDNLMLLKNHQNIEVEYLTETYLRATTSLKDLIDNFYIPLGRMIIFLQNACELVSKISAKKIGQMIIDYCQSEVVNCIISQYITKVNNLIERFIETDKFYNSTVVLSNLKNEIKKMNEYNLVHDAVNVIEEYISRLTMSVNTDRDIAEFQLFMQTIDNNIGVDLNSSSKNAVDIDGWISYDTRLPDTPQGMTILALIWKYARIPYKKRMLQNTHNVFVNKEMTQVDENSYVPGTCILNRFVYLLNSWINEGSVINEDSDNISKFDFMITDVFGENQELDAERIWEIKYNILKDGLDDFIKFVQPLFNDKVILEKVLEIGKLKRLYSLKMKQTAVSDTTNSINSYMRTLQWPVLTCAIFEDANLFNEFLDVQYNNSNKIILRLLEEEYQISKLIPKLLDFYVYKVDSQDENLLLFLNNSLLDLTKYPTFDILTILQNRFVAVYKNFGKEDEMNFFGTIMPVFDDKTLLDHVNNFNQLQKDAKNVVNNNGTARNYRNFKDLKEMLLPSVTNTESEYGNQLMNVGNEKKNTKLVSANYMKLQLDVSFPLSIVLTKTLVMQLEMVQRKLMNYYYMKKIMLDIFLEINKNEYWIKSLSDSRMDILSIKKLQYRMKLFIKAIHEYVANGVFKLNKIPEILDLENMILKEYVSELNNVMTNIMMKMWLTNIDICSCEFNIFQLIFQYCKFITHLRMKLERIQREGDSIEAQKIIASIHIKYKRYNDSFNEWLQLYSECVFVEFEKMKEECRVNLNDNTGFNGIFLTKFLKDIENILTY
ncbi:Spindle pole body component SPC97 [Hanseniaspora opuntiae]|uniref:Spindle pole body component SPC97 n=1 Tax=Hanseniaspora opuntiae TaxID=211096 RepID=A0A1E5RWE9_9ASCO|nr:Spindle pole body component SPC97 [Hanseniaspora opuntiae]